MPSLTQHLKFISLEISPSLIFLVGADWELPPSRKTPEGSSLKTSKLAKVQK